jgi:hypothetical protein
MMMLEYQRERVVFIPNSYRCWCAGDVVVQCELWYVDLRPCSGDPPDSPS